ncbi:hypothetical protein NSK_000925 [Nannochloropsis salina CCMP1776]|jgi:hypothetical protein|uniref:Tubulin-tyrosine ligase n=1 Tax=Nannochloropsis salina CCMP1776 TaxID=1027361 RepID=A0A4D9D990_9STRA|nr:hypothetical protein NSK_000925 [Nannochloropsis salina CCMP1776]|eukprot:TFJ87574.1 hypothetical protein NSK_000925 [Nannochloropsis salina CCMP1776]
MAWAWKTSAIENTRFEIKYTPYFSSIGPVSTACPTYDPRATRIWVKIECDYTRRILVKAIAKRQFRLCGVKNQKDASILWADYEDLDFDRVLASGGKIKANSYLVRKGLARKAQLAYHLRKYMAKRPTSMLHGAIPETLVIETWEAFEEGMSFGALGATFDGNLTATFSLRDRLDWCLRDARERIARSPGSTWILKPSVTNKGAEITVLKDYQSMRDIVRTWPDVREWVLQAYIVTPLLYRRRKFHLRCYVLAVGNLSVYVWRQILLLTSTVEYDSEDLCNQLAHVTNTARQVEDGEVCPAAEDCVFSLDDLIDDLRTKQHLSLEQAEGIINDIRGGIENVTGELFKALHGERTVFAPVPQCFELLGLDFLVSMDQTSSNESGLPVLTPQVHLLEVNPGPDFKQTGPRLKSVIEGLLEATLDVAVLEDGEISKDLALVYQSLHPKNGEVGMRLLDG